MPRILDAVNFDYVLQPVQKDVLHNGIPLYWLNAGTQDVVQIEWVFRAGLWHEPKTGIAQTTAALLKNGTSGKSSLQINEAIEFYGASLKVTPNNDYTIVTLHTLTKHLHDLLPVVKEIITEALFPEEEIKIYIQNARQRLSVSLKQCDFVANRNIDALLYGRQHPYGRFSEDKDLLLLKREELQAFHKKFYHFRNCTIFASGKIDDSHIKQIDSYFGKENWGSAQQPEELHHNIEPAPDKTLRITNDENGVQGAIRIARPFPGRSHPDFTPMIVLNTLFGGYFGSRLMANIREEKGYTYGIYSHIYSYKHAGSLLIATEAGREVAEDAVKEVYKEMDLLCTEKVDEDELQLVKNYILGNLLGDLDGPFSIMQRWKSLILNNLPDGQFDRNIETYKTINSRQLQDLAQKYLNKEDYYELIVI